MGTVVLSLDAELAWGFHDQQDPPQDRIERSRNSWLELLDRFDEHAVPATWAIVGHLFLDGCDGAHPDHLAPTDDWFDRDPGTHGSDRDRWFGDGLIDAVAEADQNHEIASHTFSHVEFGDVDRDVAAAEMRANVEVAEDRGFRLDSMVYPRNNVGHRDVLAAYGLRAYRGVQPRRWYERTGLRTATKFVGWPSGLVSPPLVYPEVDDYGLVNIPASLYLFSYEGAARSAAASVFDDPIVVQAKRGIDRAADSDDGVFHMWLHPNNLTEDRDFERMDAILEHVADVRADTDLAVETMSDLAAREQPDMEPRGREPIDLQ